MSDGARIRSYEWHDPARLGAFAGTHTGLEVIQAMFEGRIPPPPIVSTLDFTGHAVKEGEVTFAIQPQEIHYNPLGTMHGGVFSTILDSALGCAVHTTLKPGQGFTSLTLEVKFLRPALASTGRLYCTGRVVSRGKTVATAEADVRDDRGRVYATATSTLMIFPAPPAETAIAEPATATA